MKSALLLVALCIVLHNFPECMGCLTNWSPTPTTTGPSTTTSTGPPTPTPLKCFCIAAISVDILEYACGSVIGSESYGACFTSYGEEGSCFMLGQFLGFEYNGWTGGWTTGWAPLQFLVDRDPSYCGAENCTSGGPMRTDRATDELVVYEALYAIRNSGIFPDDNCFLRRIAYIESHYGFHPNTFPSGYFGGIWQVDDVGFANTQDTASHPGLTAKFAQIQEKLCIDWTTVEWSDLLKPLYSGLAARLYLSLNPAAIPVDLDGQARYWKDYYNTGAGAGTWQEFRDDILASEQPWDCP